MINSENNGITNHIKASTHDNSGGGRRFCSVFINIYNNLM
jgi:hypothetical protein